MLGVVTLLLLKGTVGAPPGHQLDELAERLLEAVAIRTVAVAVRHSDRRPNHRKRFLGLFATGATCLDLPAPGFANRALEALTGPSGTAFRQCALRDVEGCAA